mgnify:CR=1 FL=1
MNKNSASPIIKPSDILQTLINSEGSKKIRKTHLSASYIGIVKTMSDLLKYLSSQATDSNLIRFSLTNKSRN